MKNETKSKTQLKKTLLSVIYVFLAMTLLTYSAYAWFTMSNEITAEGMNLNVNTPDGLEISTDENDNYSNSISVNLREIVESQIDGFDANNDQFLLMPASSYDGTTLWYTSKSNSLGTALCDENDFQKGYGIRYNSASKKYEGHYVDITFWIRSSSEDVRKIKLSNNTAIIPYGEDSEGLKSVVRMAFLNSDGTTIFGDNEEPLVYSQLTKENELSVVTDDGNGISKYITPAYIDFDENGLSTETLCQLSPAEYGNDSVKYSKACVTVRIWVEGQDPKCVASIGGKQFEVSIGLEAVE